MDILCVSDSSSRPSYGTSDFTSIVTYVVPQLQFLNLHSVPKIEQNVYNVSQCLSMEYGFQGTKLIGIIVH